jgi:hypothetical protein
MFRALLHENWISILSTIITFFIFFTAIRQKAILEDYVTRHRIMYTI